jgi:hypothetical protein
VPVFHLVPQGEAVHRIEEDLRDQQVHLLALRHFNRLPARQRALNLIARSLLQDIDHFPQIVLTIHDEDFHTLLFVTCPAALAVAGRS